VFIGAIIYIAVHEDPEIPMYWNTDLNKGPLHSIPSHMSLRRFEQIKSKLPLLPILTLLISLGPYTLIRCLRSRLNKDRRSMGL
jgi:hypothetical protein